MDLPYQTVTQFAGLGLALVAGWFFGLASAPGGRKWRDRYHSTEAENARNRDAAAEDLRAKAQRIRELEAQLGKGAGEANARVSAS